MEKEIKIIVELILKFASNNYSKLYIFLCDFLNIYNNLLN